MVFPVVPEKPTAQHSPYMVPLLGPSLMGFHALRMRKAMGTVGPEIEKLVRSEKGGKNPEHKEIGQWYADQISTDIEEYGHGHQLQYGHIVGEEVDKPENRLLAFCREIGIIGGSGVVVVCHVLGEHRSITEGCEQPEGHLTDRSVFLTVSCHRSMHAVMGCYEQSGIAIGLHEDM